MELEKPILSERSTDRSKVSSKLRERYSKQIVAYLADPDNPWPTRKFICAQVLHLKHNAHIYEVMTGAELDELFSRGLDERLTRMAKKTGLVVDVLTDKAESGDLPAIKIYLETIEKLQEKNLQLRESAKEQANPLVAAIAEGVEARRVLLAARETKKAAPRATKKERHSHDTKTPLSGQNGT